MLLPRGRRTLAVAILALPLVAAACGGSRDQAADVRQVEEAVRRSIDAENRGDVGAFLALWTDDGLRSYDAGSRNELESGQATLGGEQAEVRGFPSTIVKGSQAVATVDTRVEIGLYRQRFDLVRKDGRWLLDGFRFLGPTPPPAEAPVVEVKAVEYGYDVDTARLAGGDFALRFVNGGQEPHEISLLALPAGTTKAEAVFALTPVNGRSFSGVPDGYRVLGHLAFAGPGEDGVYTLAERLAPGRYALVCFLPAGGINEFGQANRQNGEPHVALGMLSEFTVG